MATEIRNVSVDPLALPLPLSGVLTGGQAIVVSATPAQLLRGAPSLGRAFQLTDLGSGYSGPTDDTEYSAPVVHTFSADNVVGKNDNLGLAPASGGGAVRILKADGTTVAFQSNATGTSVNGATPVARAAAITSPTAPGATYVQAEAAAMKTAVDAIRVALTNFGITL